MFYRFSANFCHFIAAPESKFCFAVVLFVITSYSIHYTKLYEALFSRGHGLFIGVPGLAKTLLIHTLADSLALEFKRVQFTPDLMPSDITGTEILEEDHSTGKSYNFV